MVTSLRPFPKDMTKEYPYHLFQFKDGYSCSTGIFQLGDTFLFTFRKLEKNEDGEYEHIEVEAIPLSMDDETDTMVFDKFSARVRKNSIDSVFLPHTVFMYDCNMVDNIHEWYLNKITSPIEIELEDGWHQIAPDTVELEKIKNTVSHTEACHHADEIPVEHECCYNCAHAGIIPSCSDTTLYCKRMEYFARIQKRILRSPTNSYDDLVPVPDYRFDYASGNDYSIMNSCHTDLLNVCDEYEWTDRYERMPEKINSNGNIISDLYDSEDNLRNMIKKENL